MMLPRGRVKNGGKFGDWLNQIADLVTRLAVNWISVAPPLECINGPNGVSIRFAGELQSPSFFVKLAAPLHRDLDSEDAQPQQWSADDEDFADDPDAETVTVIGKWCYGYFFTDDIVEVREIADGVYKPVHSGGVHFEGTAAESFSQGFTGDITLTESRGTIEATAQYGDVVSGDSVSVHWDDAEQKFFVGDSECSA